MTDTYKLIDAKTTTGAGPAQSSLKSNHRTYHAIGKTSAGAGACAISILASNTGDIADAVVLGTISLTLGTTTVGDGFTSSAPWAVVFGRIDSISGTGATVSVYAAS